MDVLSLRHYQEHCRTHGPDKYYCPCGCGNQVIQGTTTFIENTERRVHEDDSEDLDDEIHSDGHGYREDDEEMTERGSIYSVYEDHEPDDTEEDPYAGMDDPFGGWHVEQPNDAPRKVFLPNPRLKEDVAAMLARLTAEEKQMFDVDGESSEDDSDIESLVWRVCREIVRAHEQTAA